MFEKNMKLAYLLDFYIDVLDEHSANIMKAYYEDDLSLAEIATTEGISRQGIRHIIKKCEEQITFLEEKLALAKKYTDTDAAISELAIIATDAEKNGNDEISKRIYDVITMLTKGV